MNLNSMDSFSINIILASYLAGGIKGVYPSNVNRRPSCHIYALEKKKNKKPITVAERDLLSLFLEGGKDSGDKVRKLLSVFYSLNTERQ